MHTGLQVLRFAPCIALAAFSCATAGRPGPGLGPVGQRRLAGAHIEVRWTPETASDLEAATVLARAERGYAAIAGLLGTTHSVPHTVSVALAGDGLGPDGAVLHVSTVSLDDGLVSLYRFPGPGGGYEASLVHELAHAVRLDLTRSALADFARGFGFVEEGFAERLAIEAGFPSEGFPTYGVPVDVVAGQWLATGEALPLSALHDRHGELNGRCFAQAYAQRVSFFAFLTERFGFSRVVAWASSRDAADAARFQAVFNEPRAALFEAWPAWAATRFDAIADGAAQAARYRSQTPAKYLPVCRPDAP